jgi:hypothetical protein
MDKVVKFVATITVMLVLGTFSVAATNSALHHPTKGGNGNTGVDTPGQCTSGWLLDGSYGFRVTNGQFIVGSLNFDGNCGLSGVNTYVGQNGGVTDSSVTGSYSVNADGTIAISLTIGEATTPQQTYLVALSRTLPGAVGMGVNGTPGEIQLIAQNNFWFWKYNDASLFGSFAAICYVNATLNYVTFDGKGNLSGVSPYYSNGTEVSNPYTGTYTVNSDGTFTGSLNGGFSQYTFYGAIENGGNQIVYMYDAAGFGIDDSCVGNR